MNNVIIEHENIHMIYEETKNGLAQRAFMPDDTFNNDAKKVSFPNFQLAIAGVPFGGKDALGSGYSQLAREMKMQNVEKLSDGIIMHYLHETFNLMVHVEMRFVENSSVIRQITSVTNNGNQPVTITHLSSMFIQGVALGGVLPWNHPSKIKLNYCLQTWEGEGQWRTSSLYDMGLFPVSDHPCVSEIHISSIGSWSTGRYLPMAVIEDTETKQVWYFQIETSGSWHYEIGFRNNSDKESGGLFILADAANERFGGWSKILHPGQTFESVPVAIGCCHGGFNEAIRELTKYRRNILRPTMIKNVYCPVIFNDYMNCLWANPTEQKLIPLINKASELGVEIFCIDAGWFESSDLYKGMILGDWEPSSNRFGKRGLKGIIDIIRSKGMIPGLWLEMEVAGEKSELADKPDSWFLMRNGMRVGGGERWFLNFTEPEVRKYMHTIVDSLIQLGIGYIKNDYNACIGTGDDVISSSPADGLLENTRAFYSFIDELRQRHSQLIIENCGSGGMRADYGILSHFHLQSITDQEHYYHNPAILSGMLAAVLPEQAGSWVYPYPLPYTERDNRGYLFQKTFLNAMEDGEQTIFNMVNGFCGSFYLSGNIDIANSTNEKLIKSGIELYKKEREHIRNSFPIWPTGFARLGQTSWVSMGLESLNGKRILLAVWRLDSQDESFRITINKIANKAFHVRQIFPDQNYKVELSYNNKTGDITFYHPQKYQARFFEILIY